VEALRWPPYSSQHKCERDFRRVLPLVVVDQLPSLGKHALVVVVYAHSLQVSHAARWGIETRTDEEGTCVVAEDSEEHRAVKGMGCSVEDMQVVLQL